MRTLLVAILLAISVQTASSQDVYVPPAAPKLEILSISTTAKLQVRLTNTSKQVMKIFNEWNSWGAMDWRVLRINNGQVSTFYQNPYQGFGKNTPSSYELLPGAHHDFKLDINGGFWCGLGHCSWDDKGLGGKKITFAKGDQIVAIYEASISEESQKLHVFSGVVAATYTVQ